MDKIYYAGHKNKNGDWQTLKDHLIGTAKLAEKFGSEIGYPVLAYFCGLYHDLGKYSEDFQQVLQGTKHGIDHTSAGAIVGISKKFDYLPIRSKVIFSHHSNLSTKVTKQYLQDTLTIPNKIPLDDKKESFSIKSLEELNKAVSLFKKEIQAKKISVTEPKFEENIFAEELFTRMLLSCLVDADYSDSCEWENKGSFEESESKPLKTNELIKELDKFIKEIQDKSNDNKKINEIRNKVLANCIESSQEERGIFTLTAPTGSGKTLAMLAFALRHAKKHNLRRIIIVLPYLSIIEQNAEIYKQICPDLLQIHSQAKLDEDNKIFVDRYTAPIIVTTSVNFFESFFKYKAVDLRRLHNMTNTVILFDEAQTLPLNIISETIKTMNLLSENYGCSIVFSTATQPAFDKFEDVKWQPKEIIKDKDEIFANSKRCEIQIDTEEKRTVQEIADRIIEEKNCCIIVNTKSTAVELYKYLREKIEEESLFYISSNLCPAHRSDVIQEIKERQKSKEKCIVISTQCIEAGIDISFDIMYRELAPLPAIIQSAGRVNRNGNNENHGKLIIFKTEKEKYPDEDYGNQAKKAEIVFNRHSNNLDLQNTEIINEYYEVLSNLNTESNELKKAIEDYDYEKIEEEYKLIKNADMIKVIVPYKKQTELYNEIIDEIVNNGLTSKLIKKAMPITLNIYIDRKKDEKLSKIYYCIYNKKQKQESGWYFLGSDIENAYNDKLGLDLDEYEENIIF